MFAYLELKEIILKKLSFFLKSTSLYQNSKAFIKSDHFQPLQKNFPNAINERNLIHSKKLNLCNKLHISCITELYWVSFYQRIDRYNTRICKMYVEFILCSDMWAHSFQSFYIQVQSMICWVYFVITTDGLIEVVHSEASRTCLFVCLFVTDTTY